MNDRKNARSLERLPDAELEVMLVLWGEGRPMKALELRDRLAEQHGWQKATVQVLLGRLCTRGFVATEDERNYKLYRPLVSEEDYRAAESSTLMRKLCRGSISTLVASLISANELDEADLDELEAMLHSGKRGDGK
ncbi:MAG: BlaI/MecI/CopY family transcriptional regulator [Clostridia bacterium]|nr:BlaI/MecI/CopY family transcriptional regulator [Clostridia bacterium]